MKSRCTHDPTSLARSPLMTLKIVALGAVAAVALAACGSSTSADSSASEAPTSADSNASEAPASEAPATAEPASLAGKRVCIPSPIEIEVLREFWDTMKAQAALPENGEEVIVVDAKGDSAKQHQQFDQFIAQGCDAIVGMFLSVDGWEEQVAAAVAKGIGVFNHSASAVGGATQNVGLGQFDSGYAVGVETARWINENLGGKAEVGVLAILEDPQLLQRSEGFKAALAELAPGATIVGEANAQDKDTGAAAAANLLQAHPGIQVLYASADDPALGALAAATDAGKTDPKTFFLASNDGTSASFEKISEGGIYQATWSYNFPFSATQLQRDIETFLRGGEVQPTRMQLGNLVTAANLAEFQALAADPRAAEVQDLYQEYMKYSDIPLAQNQPILEAFQ